MAVTSKIQTTVSFSNGTTSQSGKVSDTGATFTTQDNSFAAASTNASMTLAFVKANLQSFFVVSDQNCTVKTNSSATPQDTISLVAGVPFVWSKSSGLTNPFAGDVTSAFVTCTPAARIQYAVLQT